MSKTQKIWLGIFLALFIVPEVLWSPVGNYLYIFLKGGNNPEIFRPNILMDPDHKSLLLQALTLQVGGLIGAISVSFKSNFSPKWIKTLLLTCLLIFFILSAFVLYVIWATRNIWS